jgi:hypothetical protein
MVRWAAAISSLGLVAACGSAGTDLPALERPHSQASGTLTGRLIMVGGPAPGAPSAVSGTVVLSGGVSADHRDVGPDGTFRFSPPPGRYRLTGTSPSYGSGIYPCRANGRPHVQANQTTRADVVCELR